jgi:hypothetical protein
MAIMVDKIDSEQQITDQSSMLNNQEVQRVQQAIDVVVDKFRKTPNIFLTEDDLRIHLCNQLLQHFGEESVTKDSDRSIPLHTEVRWYGRDGKLKLRSDIVLIDVGNLNVLHSFTMPSKGYGFDIPNAIIELKLRRPTGESNKEFSKKLGRDIRKIKKLRTAVCDATGHQDCETKFWFVIFDKKAEIEVSGAPGITVCYKYATKAIPPF